MEKAAMKVIRLGAGDVIATSLQCTYQSVASGGPEDIPSKVHFVVTSVTHENIGGWLTDWAHGNCYIYSEGKWTLNGWSGNNTKNGYYQATGNFISSTVEPGVYIVLEAPGVWKWYRTNHNASEFPN